MERQGKDQAGAASSRNESSNPASHQAKAARSPQVWLDEIRELRRAGREDEAVASVKLFLQAYPDFPLPQDLLPRP